MTIGRAAVEAALAGVLDPELDEPLLELGFLSAITVAGDAVRVELRLPTFWCSASFAYIMGEDILAALDGLPGVASAEVALVDHFAAAKVNAGLAARKPFEAAFGAEAGGGLAALRATFADKQFLGRQAALIGALRREGAAAEAIVGLTLGSCAARADAAPYLALRQRRSVAPAAEGLAFVTLEGAPIAAAALLGHLREGRRIRGSFAANAELCRALHAARYGPDAAPDPDRAA